MKSSASRHLPSYWGLSADSSDDAAWDVGSDDSSYIGVDTWGGSPAYSSADEDEEKDDVIVRLHSNNIRLKLIIHDLKKQLDECRRALKQQSAE